MTRIKSSRLKPLPREQRAGTRNFRRSVRVAAGVALVLALILALDVRGPSAAAESVDETRRAPHMDVRRFPRGQDALSENPAGSANPVQRTGREGGVCFLCARFLCTSKERWLAPSRRESFCSLRCCPAGRRARAARCARPPPPGPPPHPP